MTNAAPKLCGQCWLDGPRITPECYCDASELKERILISLTRSKNERKAFTCIWELTVGKGKGNCLISDKQFQDYGLKHRNRRNEAVLRLIEKGLIFRAEQDPYWYDAKHRIFRYSIKKSGCVRFLKDTR